MNAEACVEVALHERGDESRIDSAAQIEPDRHICAQPQANGFLELMQHLGRVSSLVVDGPSATGSAVSAGISLQTNSG